MSGGQEGVCFVSSEEFKVVMKFKEGGGVMSPISLTAALKKAGGEIKLARVLRNGNYWWYVAMQRSVIKLLE